MLKIFTTGNKSIDWSMLTSIVILSALGLLMVYSSSSPYALNSYGDSAYFLKRQALFLLIGLALLFLLMRVDYRFFAKLVYPGYLLGLVLLVAVLIPGIGKEVGGARRWIDLGFMSFQPTEFAKFTLILYMAHSITKKKEKMDTFMFGFLSHVLMAGLYIILTLLEPDFGMATIMMVVLFGMLFIGGINFRYIALSAILSGGFLAWGILSEGYRMSRVMAFINPWKDPLGSGYQAVQSFVALGMGGLYGTGLGNSTQKLFFLPEAHTDFIFSILGEELGFVAVATVVLLFAWLLIRGIRVALRSPDLFGCYLVFGCITVIALQAATNMAVAVGLFPTKGLTLPLVSYGGTSLISTLGALGVMLSVSRESVK